MAGYSAVAQFSNWISTLKSYSRSCPHTENLDACFGDFKEDLDSVWHDGLQYSNYCKTMPEVGKKKKY